MEEEKPRKETFEEMRARIKAPKTKQKRKKKPKPQGFKTYKVPKNLPPKNYSNVKLANFENGFSLTDKQFKEKYVKPKKAKTVKKSKQKKSQIASVGEKIIESFFKKFLISYKREYMFKDCINPNTGGQLRFDFYLKELNMCIEFDGIQHFKPSELLHGDKAKEKLIDQQFRDNLKTQYCKEKNIKLIRYNYKQYGKLEKLLEKKFLLNC